MRHRLIKQLRAEVKSLRAEIRRLKSRKPLYSDPIAEFLANPIDLKELTRHFETKKYR